MKHSYLIVILLFCISCSGNRRADSEEISPKLETRKTRFDPMKSPQYERVFIGLIHQQNKDTLLNAEALTARIMFDENIEMLKAVADEENLGYKIDYDADAINQKNKSLMISPSEDNDYADVRFIVAANDSTNQYQKMMWRYSIKFSFLELNMPIYDTIFTNHVPYIVKLK